MHLFTAVPNPDENFLNYILRIVIITQHSQGKAKKLVFSRQNTILKGLEVHVFKSDNKTLAITGCYNLLKEFLGNRTRIIAEVVERL